MPNVYIPQSVRRYDGQSQKLKPLFDFTQAANYGNLREVIDEFEDLLFIEKLTGKVKESLAEFSAEDYLIAVGDPTLIAICAAVLFRKFDRVNMLKWDRKTQTYLKVEIGL